MYTTPGADVLFGDIFEAPYVFDVHLQADAVRLSTSEFPQAAPLSGVFHAEPQEKLPLQGDVVRAHGRSGRELQGREHKGSYDLPGRAILVSDDCHIPTAYGNRPDRSEARGRLMFASVVPADEESVAAVESGASYGRFALPPDELFPEGAVAELRRTFLVAAKAVDPDHRLVSLDGDGRHALERRWNAYTCRRGPETSMQNARKLGQLIAGGKFREEPLELNDEQNAAITALWQTLDLGWDFEGATMRRVSDAFEQGREAQAAVDAVVTDLRGVSALAQDAAQKLAAFGSS